MAAGAEAAIAEVSASGQLLSGSTVTAIRADSTCIDSAVASANAEKLITADKVNGIMGADCSGVTGAILANVAMANGMVMISPSATSPALSTAEDNGLFFRTAPSDARQGAIMSNVLMDKGITSVAVSYTNNDYGKGLADAFQAAYEADGGSVTINAAHEEGKADYSSEVGALASAGGQALVVAGYIDGAGKNVTQGAIDTGAFDMFLFPDGMIGANLENFGTDIDGSLGTVPGLDPTNPAASAMAKIGEANGFAGGDDFDDNNPTKAVFCPVPTYGRYVCLSPTKGFYVDTPGTAVKSPARVGHYVAIDGASSDTPCLEGTYQSLTGQTACNDCLLYTSPSPRDS